MRFIARSVDWIAAFLLVAMIVLANWAVFQRYVMGQPLAFSEEIGGVLLLWLVLVGAISAERKDEHLTISFLVELLPGGLRRVVDCVVGIATLAVLLGVAWIGWGLAESVGARVTNTVRFSFFWIYLAVPVCFLGIAILVARRTFSTALGAGEKGERR